MALLVVGAGATAWTGCRRDVRLAGRKLRSVTVGVVTHYGMTLNRDASPKEVTYVLLRAIRDDVLARTAGEREAALDTQFDLCAADVIAAKNQLDISRDEFIYNVVYRWTPTVSHYVHDFETAWEKAEPRMVVVNPARVGDSGGEARKCEVQLELDDPDGDANARVVMIVYLAQDNGYWRVTHLGFDPMKRKIGS